MECWSFSVLERQLYIFLDLFALHGGFNIFVIHLDDLFFDRLFDLVKYDRRLDIERCFRTFYQLLGGVVVLDVKDVKVAVASDVHPMEPIESRVVENHIGVAKHICLVDPLATLPIEYVNVLA